MYGGMRFHYQSNPYLFSTTRKGIAYGVTDYASIKNLLLQQVHPRMIVDSNCCLTGHPELADVVVQQQPLTRYDSLLQGGEQINE